MKRIALTFVSIALGAAAIPAAAPAASYDVLVCHAAPGNANHAFTEVVNDNPSRRLAVATHTTTDEWTTERKHRRTAPKHGPRPSTSSSAGCSDFPARLSVAREIRRIPFAGRRSRGAVARGGT